MIMSLAFYSWHYMFYSKVIFWARRTKICVLDAVYGEREAAIGATGGARGCLAMHRYVPGTRSVPAWTLETQCKAEYEYSAMLNSIPVHYVCREEYSAIVSITVQCKDVAGTNAE